MPTQPIPRGWCYPPGSSIIRGYDSSLLFREDFLLRIQHLQMEMDADLKELARMIKEYAAFEERYASSRKSLPGSTSSP